MASRPEYWWAERGEPREEFIDAPKEDTPGQSLGEWLREFLLPNTMAIRQEDYRQPLDRMLGRPHALPPYQDPETGEWKHPEPIDLAQRKFIDWLPYITGLVTRGASAGMRASMLPATNFSKKIMQQLTTPKMRDIITDLSAKFGKDAPYWANPEINMNLTAPGFGPSRYAAAKRLSQFTRPIETTAQIAMADPSRMGLSKEFMEQIAYPEAVKPIQNVAGRWYDRGEWFPEENLAHPIMEGTTPGGVAKDLASTALVLLAAKLGAGGKALGILPGMTKTEKALHRARNIVKPMAGDTSITEKAQALKNAREWNLEPSYIANQTSEKLPIIAAGKGYYYANMLRNMLGGRRANEVGAAPGLAGRGALNGQVPLRPGITIEEIIEAMPQMVGQ